MLYRRTTKLLSLGELGRFLCSILLSVSQSLQRIIVLLCSNHALLRTFCLAVLILIGLLQQVKAPIYRPLLFMK